MKETLAIIDLGSNSVRMNIYGMNERGGYSVLDQAKEMVRLSEGLSASGALGEAPMDRTLKALEYFRQLMGVNGVRQIFPMATAAVRSASNGLLFLERIHAETGLEFRVLSGLEEAQYDYLGVVNGLSVDNAVIVDTGGGSTEIILVKHRELCQCESIPLGSVVLTERFAQRRGSLSKQLRAAEDAIDEALHPLKWLGEAEGFPVIGLGGTIRSLGKVDYLTRRFPVEAFHGHTVPREALDVLLSRIIETPATKLARTPGISHGRADVMRFGVLPLKAIVTRVEAPFLRLSGYGLREGVLYETLAHTPGNAYSLPGNQTRTYMRGATREHAGRSGVDVYAVTPNVLESALSNMMRRFYMNERHGDHVRDLAMALADGLAPLFECSPLERHCLDVAARLHDIGMHIAYYDHHLHGMYLMLNNTIEGLGILPENGKKAASDAQNTPVIAQLMVAYLVGNHRDKGVKRSVFDFWTHLGRERVLRLQRVALMLQIAEQLDRSEASEVSSLCVDIGKRAVRIALTASGNVSLDIQSARRIAPRFKKVMGRELEIECVESR